MLRKKRALHFVIVINRFQIKLKMKYKILGCLIRMNKSYNDGTPCARKLACTVWSGGKIGDYIKGLPIAITGYANSS